MTTLVNMTIACSDIKKIKENYYQDLLGDDKVLVCGTQQCEFDNVESLDIGSITVLKVSQYTSPKDLIGFAKQFGIDVIVLENSVDMFNELYRVFNSLEEFLNHIVESRQSYELSEITASKIAKKFDSSDDFADTVHKVYEVCKDKRIFPEEIRELFIF